jgi:deferrochelatase/peroxidase EfeB
VPDSLPQAPGDFDGVICPHASHIRKVNPRDIDTDTGGFNDTLSRRILRRGIPYGDPLPPSVDAAAPESQRDRGLLFLCYQTSIVDQFEFLTNHWINTSQVPEDGGFDIIIGQNGQDAQRERSVQLVATNQQPETVTFDREWVIPTGGGYFFAPSIEALKTVLSS